MPSGRRGARVVAAGRRPCRARPGAARASAREGAGAGARGRRSLAAAVAVAAEPPRWVRHVLGDAGSAPPPRGRRSASLPAGRLLVSSSQGTWIVRGDGTRLRLGPWTAATWSPRGLYVAAWRGRELSAVAPNGRVAWTIAARGTVRDATWSPDGYRIAYRRDDVLAVVAGDGTGARILAQPVRAVAPAWRPGAPHTLAWVGASGRIEVRDVDTGARRLALDRERRRGDRAGVVGRRPPPPGARSPARRRLRRDGQALLACAPAPRHAGRRGGVGAARRPDRARAAQRHGHERLRDPRAARAPAARVHHDRHAALARLVAQRPRLLVRWADADQWLLLSPSAANARITAIGSISRRFGAPPTVQGWCCG